MTPEQVDKAIADGTFKVTVLKPSGYLDGWIAPSWKQQAVNSNRSRVDKRKNV